MATDLDLDQLDRRMVDRLIKKGLLSEKDWEKHLKALPDLADSAQPVETEFEAGAVQREG